MLRTKALAAYFFICSACFAQSDIAQEYNRGNRFELSLGIVASSDYEDFMREEFSNISGFLGWVCIETGFSIQLSKKIQITPGILLLGSSIETTVRGFEGFPNRRANVILLPGISTRYYGWPKANSLYAGINLSYVSPHSDFNSLNFDSNGLSIGVNIGFRFTEFEAEVGNINVPVKANFNDSNFGGIYIIFRRYF